MSLRKNIQIIAASLALMGASGIANAVPDLQLGILGATYDTTTETSLTSATTFSLYAFSDGTQPLGDIYKLSIALLPPTSSGGTFGSFSVGGTTYDVTGDMTYGIPPIETIYSQLADPGDLPTHSVYPTYFLELSFSFSSADKASFACATGDPNNVQDCAALTGLTTGAGEALYYKKFDFDVSGLLANNFLHFDLYNLTICTSGTGQCDGTGDNDVNKFAPFSHDAGTTSSSSSSSTGGDLPEPNSSSLALLGLAMLGTAFGMRRRKLNG